MWADCPRHAEHISKLARLFDWEFVKTMIQNHRNGTRDEGVPLWALLNLALWYDYWIDRKSI
jgi:hypothetical protein